jgi:hypothetical protein
VDLCSRLLCCRDIWRWQRVKKLKKIQIRNLWWSGCICTLRIYMIMSMSWTLTDMKWARCLDHSSSILKRLRSCSKSTRNWRRFVLFTFGVILDAANHFWWSSFTKRLKWKARSSCTTRNLCCGSTRQNTKSISSFGASHRTQLLQWGNCSAKTWLYFASTNSRFWISLTPWFSNVFLNHSALINLL